MKRSNLLIAMLALVAVAAWGLVVRQEVQRRRLGNPTPRAITATLPAGTRVTIPAPGSGPTEETPVLEIHGTITDAETGQPVVADVQAANVHLDDVTEFRLVFPLSRSPLSRSPAGDEAITITVTAPGYKTWSVDLTPHIQRSKRIDAPIKLQPKPDEGLDEEPVHDQA